MTGIITLDTRAALEPAVKQIKARLKHIVVGTPAIALPICEPRCSDVQTTADTASPPTIKESNTLSAKSMV